MYLGLLSHLDRRSMNKAVISLRVTSMIYGASVCALHTHVHIFYSCGKVILPQPNEECEGTEMTDQSWIFTPNKPQK